MENYRPDLFYFEWYVDQHGYDAVSAEDLPEGVRRPVLKAPTLPAGQGFYLKRKGGPLRAYRPLDDQPGLARRFAYLPKTPSAFLEFANEFGFLGAECSEHPDDVEWEEHSPWWHTHVQGFLSIVEGIDRDEKHSIASIFNQYVAPDMTVRIEAATAKRSALQVVPLNLIAAMWLQIAGELTDGTTFRKCDWCPTWFPYGPGTGHRETRRFCSPRCRKASNRYEKGEGQ
jgi:hypothetical protein